MAASFDIEVNVSTENGTVLKTGLMYKQGGSYRNWKKRYFVLYETFLSYYAKPGDSTPKGNIDLTMGRGIRLKNQCDLDWPKSAKHGLAFGLAIEERTYYLYGDNQEAVKDWMTLIQQCINKIGQPCDDHRSDPEGKPEGKLSKMMKGGAKLASKVTKMMIKNAGVDENVVSTAEGVADAVENQADAERDAMLADRLKMAAGDTTGVVGHNVDNAYVSVATDVVQGQCEAKNNTSVQQHLMMGAATTIQGTGGVLYEEGEGNQDMMIIGGVLTAAGRVVRDQVGADDHLCIKQIAGDSAIGGTGEALRPTLREERLQPLIDAIGIASGVTTLTDWATMTKNTPRKNRRLIATSSAADGSGKLDLYRKYSGCRGVTNTIKHVVDDAREESG